MRLFSGIVLTVTMTACGGQPPPIDLTEDEIAWCTRNPVTVVDAYSASGASALEGTDTDVIFTVVLALNEGEMLLGSPPPVTDEQRNAIREACRSAFEAD